MMMAMILLAVATFSAADGDREQAIRLARDAIARDVSSARAAAATVADVTDVMWPDSSLGCPSAGVVYTPSVIAGYRVRLQVGAATYTVHVGNGRAVMCGSNSDTAGAGGLTAGGKADGRSADDVARGLKLAEQARGVLAARLQIPSTQIAIESYRVTTWPDIGLGCDDAGVTRSPQPTKGFRIHLRAGERTFEFHSDMARVVECAALTVR